MLMFLWFLLFLYVTQSLGNKFGVPSLFLAPEYLGEIGVFSFAILGMALGGFLMAFNIYSYILHANEFPFLATLTRPFLKFCYNNIIIPLGFYVTLIYKSYYFQTTQELIPPTDALLNLTAFTITIWFFIMLSMLYFLFLNKNIFKISGKDEAYYDKLPLKQVKESTLMKQTKWYTRMSRVRKRKVVTYIATPISIRLARATSHYDRHLLQKVFSQHHINASIFEIGLVLLFFSLGIFRDVEWVNIPAAASMLLLFTVFLLIFSSFYSWFKGWTLTVLIMIIVSVNFLTNYTTVMKFKNYGYGLDYSKNVSYKWDDLQQLTSDEKHDEKSIKHTLQILENWKTKNQKLTNQNKPKLILLNISGGGLRSSMWSMRMIQHIDSVTNNQFFEQTQLISGASGGMLGAAYYRELFLQNKNGNQLQLWNHKYADNIAQDMLNPLTFGIAVNDLLFRYQHIKDGAYSYTKDRGYSFEQKLIQNLDGTFSETRLYDYLVPEINAEIPMMILAPTVVNDGRRMLISPQPIGYMSYQCMSDYTNTYNSMENIEFSKLFENNNPLNLKMTSALRMNATFPYILPMVTLPTDPPIELMDAGVRDNYGLKTSLEFLRKFKNWISTNTSGVILVELRDKQKNFEVENPNNGSLITRLFAPLGSVYSNTLKTHDYNNDQLLLGVDDWYSGQFDVVTFYLDQNKGDEITMSWHLTSLDKQNIYKAIGSKDNQKACNKLIELLGEAK